MSEHNENAVFIPSEVQRLKLQLAEQQWSVANAERAQMDAEQRYYQLARDIAEASLKYIQAEDARLARRQEQLARRVLEITEEIKAQNDWPAEVTYDVLTGQFAGNTANDEVATWVIGDTKVLVN